jgi:hypothetical protein
MVKKLRFLVSLHTRENDFQVAQGQSAVDSARKLESDVEIVFADNDAVNQSTQLLKAIQGRLSLDPTRLWLNRLGARPCLRSPRPPVPPESAVSIHPESVILDGDFFNFVSCDQESFEGGADSVLRTRLAAREC